MRGQQVRDKGQRPVVFKAKAKARPFQGQGQGQNFCSWTVLKNPIPDVFFAVPRPQISLAVPQIMSLTMPFNKEAVSKDPITSQTL